MVRPERFELPTNRFEADYSIQLSYGRFIHDVGNILPLPTAAYADPVTFMLNCPSDIKKALHPHVRP